MLSYLEYPRNKVLDGISDCADGSDECPDPNAFEDDPLSSRDQLIKFPAFHILIWLIGLLAAVGNTVVFASTLKRVLLMQFDTALCSPMEICLLRNKQGELAQFHVVTFKILHWT